MDATKPGRTRVVISMEGGVINDIRCDGELPEILIVDYDDTGNRAQVVSDGAPLGGAWDDCSMYLANPEQDAVLVDKRFAEFKAQGDT